MRLQCYPSFLVVLITTPFSGKFNVRLFSTRSLALCCLGLLCLNVACSKNSKPDVGVRPEFKGVPVDRVVMTPFYLSSGMGLGPEARDDIKLAYEQQTQAWLTAQGFEVVSPQAFQQQLTEAGVWQVYADGMTFRQSLDQYFLEANPGASASVEVLALQTLLKSGALPEGDAILFGEVVYQTQTRCRVHADEVVEFAVVEQVGSMVGSDGEVSCVVGHLQSTLVDPKSQKMMWINRGLVELHVEALTDAMTKLNIERVVEFVYSGKKGLTAFRR